MAHITTKDGVKLHYEEAGARSPPLFLSHIFRGPPPQGAAD